MATNQTNYIQHLTAFIKFSQKDDRLTGNHISLYMAMFFIWNENFFARSFKINRAKLLKISHIGSNHTYRKCIVDLEKFGYIKYWRSVTPGKPSSIALVPMGEIRQCKNASPAVADMPADGSKNAPQPGADMPPVINNINSLNNERGALPSENKKPENLKDVIAFFDLLGQPESEAAKFFHHYEANGWMQGSRIPIVKWKDAARKWILNINSTETSKNGKRKQGTGANTGHLHTNQNKSYSDPL